MEYKIICAHALPKKYTHIYIYFSWVYHCQNCDNNESERLWLCALLRVSWGFYLKKQQKNILSNLMPFAVPNMMAADTADLTADTGDGTSLESHLSSPSLGWLNVWMRWRCACLQCPPALFTASSWMWCHSNPGSDSLCWIREFRPCAWSRLCQ